MKKSVLLTGATGFVGRNLLPLLVQRGYHVYALVRPKLGKTPEERLTQLLEGTNSEGVTLNDVTLVEGDLTQDLAGISYENLERMRGEIDILVHSGAMVRFDEDLAEETHNVNVGGTKRMIEVANQVAAPKFYYVSTAYTLGAKNYAEEEMHPIEGPFSNPYEKSKCESEHLVMEASRRGDFQAALFRPAAIIGDSRTGLADTSISLYGIIKVMRVFARKVSKSGRTDIHIRLNADPESTLNLVPVDYVCESIASGVEQAVDSGIYHITNARPPKTERVFSIISQNLDMPADFIRFVKGLPADEMTDEEKYLDSLLHTFKAYLNKSAMFDDPKMRELFAANGNPPFVITEQMIKFIIGTHMGVPVEPVTQAEATKCLHRPLRLHFTNLHRTAGPIPHRDRELVEELAAVGQTNGPTAEVH